MVPSEEISFFRCVPSLVRPARFTHFRPPSQAHVYCPPRLIPFPDLPYMRAEGVIDVPVVALVTVSSSSLLLRHRRRRRALPRRIHSDRRSMPGTRGKTARSLRP